jgi:hypothetical protein
MFEVFLYCVSGSVFQFYVSVPLQNPIFWQLSFPICPTDFFEIPCLLRNHSGLILSVGMSSFRKEELVDLLLKNKRSSWRFNLKRVRVLR